MNIGLLKCGCRVTACWRLMKMCEVVTLNIHVYAVIAGNILLRPYFLPPHLTGSVYHDFLRNVLTELLQDGSLQTEIHLWFVHYGARPNFLLAFRKFFKNVFLKQWPRRAGPTAWPARSTVLNTLDFYTLGYLKSNFLTKEFNYLQDLQTTNRESIWEVPYDTWNFPAS